MSDKMTAISFGSLIMRMMKEYKLNGSIFGIYESNFFKKQNKKIASIFGEKCSMPLGPAAGPHTQLSQNIISSFLTGARFLELKTVQLKVPHVSKPCIDAKDECYNVEWSSEYEVENAYEEYAKAWVLLYFLEELFDLGMKDTLERSFIFNMSVGYDMAGIKSERVDNYINALKDSSKDKKFEGYLKELDSIIESKELKDILSSTKLLGKLGNLKNISKRISPNICKSLTLSTMHGCPPEEIEKIASYMLKEKSLNTYVKLNPTLLGYERVRNILDSTGFNYIELKKDSFTHDLQYEDGREMLNRLIKIAKENGKYFGVKLTNTLGNINDKEVLPGDERYMSGRALFPLSISVADMISRDFKGELPISFSGGMTVYNAKKIFETGIKPLTMATDLLKPGGYNRFNQIANILEESNAWDIEKINVESVSRLAKEALEAKYSKKSFRGFDSVKLNEKLPMIDCAVAPCTIECPIHQPIPEYIRLTGEGKYDEAVNIITQGNILPAITGHICDHKCQKKCTRLDYERSIHIRDIKGLAVSKGKRPDYTTKNKNNIKVAVIGAGPAGLSAAAVLAREGFNVTVKEKEKSAGGVVRYVIPEFRIPEEILKSDIKSIEALGVKFEFGVKEDFYIDELRDEGYSYICIATGAYEAKKLDIKGDNKNIVQAIDFLYNYNKNPDSINFGEKIAVIGAGNTGMDAARAALKVKNVKDVTVIYRRSEHEMPADEEEIELAKKDGVKFYTLANPEEFLSDGTLICRKMMLGEKDKSGRRSPVPTEETFTLKVDTLIPSLGYTASEKELKNAGLKLKDGNAVFNKDTLETSSPGVFIIGDSRTGPSSIVKCIADGTKAAFSICKKHNSSFEPREYKIEEPKVKDILSENLIKRKTIYDIQDNKEFAKIEASRCLECNLICNKCVDVCPNRANIALKMDGFNNYFEIVHIDAYCNECGNCSTFCPWNGNPYKDKITVFSSKKDLDESENTGFFFDRNNIYIRCDGKVSNYNVQNGHIDGFISRENGSFIMIAEEIINRYVYLTESL